MSMGGVGRNVAEVIARLGGSPALLSVVGKDDGGSRLLASCSEVGIATRAVQCLPEARTATFHALLDGSGELVGAVADMAIFEELTPELVRAARDQAFGPAALVVCDANMGGGTLAAALECSIAGRTPAWFEPVSVAKATRGRCQLPWHLVSPNWDELRAMVGRPPAMLVGEGSRPFDALPVEVAETLGEALSCKLAEHVLLTMGPHGVVLASEIPVHPLPCSSLIVDVGQLLAGVARVPDIPPIVLEVQEVEVPHGCGLWYRLLRPVESVRDTTGAGDALMGGMACAFAAGWPLAEAVVAGMTCAHITLFSDGAVAPFLNAVIIPRLRMVLGQRSRL